MLTAAAPLRGGLLVMVLALLPFAADAQRWVLVDTDALTLTVMDDERPLLTLHDVSIGRYGASRDKRRGDNTTPLGRFRITRIDRQAEFHRFIGLSYPDPARARAALRDGIIDADQHRAIVAAHQRREAPPQNTPLGGHIGIHGLGRADPELHQAMNWTKGCVALTDAQVDTLLLWVDVGMMVEVR